MQSSSGLPAVSQKLQDVLHSEAFNEEEYDKAMQDLFNDGYYEVGRNIVNCQISKSSYQEIL